MGQGAPVTCCWSMQVAKASGPGHWELAQEVWVQLPQCPCAPGLGCGSGKALLPSTPMGHLARPRERRVTLPTGTSLCSARHWDHCCAPLPMLLPHTQRHCYVCLRVAENLSLRQLLLCLWAQ